MWSASQHKPTLFLQSTLLDEMFYPRISIPARLVPHLPLFDSIALLVVVLNLPVVIYTLLHTLYVCCTFAPVSPTFHSFSRAYTPSIASVLVTDIVLALGLSFWPSLKALPSEFANVVFATQLVGGGWKSIGVCTTIVAGLRVIRNTFEIHNSPVTGVFWLPGSEFTFSDIVKGFQTSILGWLQQIVSLHILSTFFLEFLYGRLRKKRYSEPEFSTSLHSNNESCSTLIYHWIYQPIWSFLATAVIRSKLSQSETSTAVKAASSSTPLFWVHKIGHSLVTLASNAPPDIFSRLTYTLDNLPWPQISLISTNVEEDETVDAAKHKIQKVVILGLNCATEYSIEISSPDLPELCVCINLRTMPSQVTSIKELSHESPNLDDIHRESASLHESRQRIKKLRKDNGKALSLMRGELENLKSKSGIMDKGEERARRRILFLREFVRRIEEESLSLQSSIENLRQTIIDQKGIENETHTRWEVAKSNQEKIESEAQLRIAEADQILKTISNESSLLSSRKEKLALKNRKLTTDLARCRENPDVEGVSMVLSRQKKRSELIQQRKQVEQEFLEQISRVERSTLEILDASGIQSPSVIYSSTL